MRIAITFPNHWSIKNILHSGVASTLQNHAEIIGITDPARIPHLEKLVADLGLRPIEWVGYLPPPESRRLTNIRRMQKSFVYHRYEIETERIMEALGKRPKCELLGSKLMRLVSISPFVNQMAKGLAKRRWELTSQVIPPMVDLLFTTNPVDFREDPLVKGAKQAGIPVVTMVPSWDNLTSKGVIFTEFDEVYVWNEVMQQEVLMFMPGLTKSHVPIVGIPRFSVYEGSYQGQKGRKILFANTATKSFPGQPSVARQIAEALQNGAFGDAQLLVRCHPHDNPSEYAFLRRYDKVTVWPESSDSFGIGTVPPPNDLCILRDMLRWADVCVNCASTIVLDAAASDVPIVSVAYDSVKHFYAYTHQRPFLESHAARLVDSPEHLVTAIREALDSPESRQLQRANLARLATQGNPHERLSHALLNWDTKVHGRAA